MFQRYIKLLCTSLLLISPLTQASPTPQVLDNSATMQWLYQDKGVIIDVRDSNLYNGWPAPGELRGGHLPGAENLPLSWLKEDTDELAKRLASSNIKPGSPLLIYGSTPAQSREAVKLLHQQGFPIKQLHIYRDPFSVWAETPSLPLTHLANYQALVSAAWLHRELKKPAEQRPLIVEASYGKGLKYLLAHIPGAIHLNTDSVESGPEWNLLPPQKLAENMAKAGLSRDRTIVLYGQPVEAAARVLFALHYIGAKDVRLLNGGLKAWEAAGFATDIGAVEPNPVTSFGKITLKHQSYITLDELKKLQRDPGNMRLVSVRSWPEYLGEISGYSYIKGKGHIPGAIWGHSGTNKDNVVDFLNPDGTLRTDSFIHRAWSRAGLTPDKHLIFYCGTGWRASLTWFYANLIGYPEESVYDGGWLQWSRDKTNRIALGALPG
ncbi:rhodanese-like domain-containing protein [Dongshaea marina]|uniref:rhodanese-like domain-containing protein n=1 Tax=Dongshaea marina TaxID=2047966 RepID=UPI000D3E4C08|nr:rhodanese-like domain-containing protein [Dongshaea marina]